MNETPVAVPSTSHVPRADLTTSMALLTKMQRAHQAVDDLAEEGHRIATEHDHALTHCRDELQRIDVACKTVVGDSAGSTYDAVVRVLDKLVEAQAVIAHLEGERARAEQAEDLVRQSHKAAVAENAKLREVVDAKVAETLASMRGVLVEAATAAEKTSGWRQMCRLTNCGGDVEMVQFKPGSDSFAGICDRCGEVHNARRST